MSELPEDLLEEILSRVPATSLKQLQSTCKRWNRLFNDRRFTRKHLDKTAKQFLIHMWKESRVCSMRIDLHRIPHVKVTGKSSLINPHSSFLHQVEIFKVSHCDGLLLCVTKESNTRLVVWNPCTGRTKWIHHRNCYNKYDDYALGSYQDKRSNDNSYKILRHRSYDDDYYKHEFEIYEFKTNSWRILDVTFDYKFGCILWGVTLKGKTYWIANYEKKIDTFLISFDYTTERFERLCVPYQYPIYQTLYLTLVREEKLSVLLMRDYTSKAEIWVTNKIGETKVVSWSMVFAVNLMAFPGLRFRHDGSFLVDEEKKVLVCCNDRVYKGKTMVCIVGEDNKVKEVDFEVGSSMPFLVYYVPSLTQIPEAKIKRGECL